MSAGPNRQMALQQYRSRAPNYDFELAIFEPIRRQAIAQLQLKSGARVIDVGCGTGLSFALLQQGVGAKGHIIGIEQSPDMMALAAERVAQHGWTNVNLLNLPVEEADIGFKADAALFHFTHDILRCRAAVQNIVRHLKPGARLVASGLQWGAPWDWATNSFVLLAALNSASSLEGLDRPWNLLAELVGEMNVFDTSMTGFYIASGALKRASKKTLRSRDASE